MKILQVIPFFPPAYSFGGPVIGAHRISKELVRKGHEVVVYTTDASVLSSRLDVPFDRLLDGIRVYSFNNISMLFVKHSNLFLTSGLLLQAIKELKTFDMVHLHEFRTFQNIVVSRLARHYQIPYILQANGSLDYLGRCKRKRLFDLVWGNSILHNASKLIALSSFEVEQYKSFDIPEEKITVIPSAFDFHEYVDLPSEGRFRAQYDVKKDENIILYLGRIHEIKGLDVLTKAFAYLIKEYKREDVMLSIVGPNDGFLGELTNLINRLRIRDKVLFTGPLYGEEKLEAYVDADIFVMPSRYEAFSRSLREASACGKPVIASNVGGLHDIVVNNETGLLVAPGDVEQLTQAMHSLLVDNKRSKEMGLRGRKLMQEKFSVEKVTAALEHLFQDLASN